MTEFIENIFSSIFGNNVILATILIAMVPVIELKGAIPFSMAVDIWGTNALAYLPAFLCGILGSSLIVPILALLYLPIIRWLKKTKLFRKFAEKIENRLNRKKEEVDKKLALQDVSTENSENIIDKNDNVIEKTEQSNKQVDINAIKKARKSFWIKFFSVFLFVAIPLPLTGVWTGTCLAVVLGLNFWQTCLCVIPANILAGLIITFVSTLFGDSTWIFVLILLGIIAFIAIVYLIKKIVQKIKLKREIKK